MPKVERPMSPASVGLLFFQYPASPLFNLHVSSQSFLSPSQNQKDRSVNHQQIYRTASLSAFNIQNKSLPGPNPQSQKLPTKNCLLQTPN